MVLQFKQSPLISFHIVFQVLPEKMLLVLSFLMKLIQLEERG